MVFKSAYLLLDALTDKFISNIFFVKPSDYSARVAFDVSNIPTKTTRVVTFPNADITLGVIDYSLVLKLNQSPPQTFTGGTVTGSGLLKVTSGQLGLDTSTYLDSTTAGNTYAKLDQTIPQSMIGIFNFPDLRLTLSGTVNRNITTNIITSVVKTGGRTLTPTRDANGFITSLTDGIKTWTFTRNANNFITSWGVT